MELISTLPYEFNISDYLKLGKINNEQFIEYLSK